MKATANREGLLTAVQIASTVVPARSPKPILTHVKLVALDDGKAAAIMATDLDLGITYRVSGLTFDVPGAVVIPAQKALAILREIPDDEVTLESTGSAVRIKGRSARFDLLAEDPMLFPEVGVVHDGEVCHRMVAGELATLIKRTVFAASNQNSRFALCSVRMEFDAQESRVVLVATDSRRLAMMPGQAAVAATGREALVPPKALALLQKVLLDPEEEIEIAIRSNDILFRSNKVTIYSRLVEGRFPRYQDVIPKTCATQIPLVVGQVSGAVRQSKIVTDSDSKGVAFRFHDGVLTLTSRSPKAGESQIELPTTYSGPATEVTLDPDFLLDAFRVLEPEVETMFEITDDKRKSVFRTQDGYAYVVMPIHQDADAAPPPPRSPARVEVADDVPADDVETVPYEDYEPN